jgi:hypothetical protein
MQGKTLLYYLEAVPVLFVWEDDFEAFEAYETALEEYEQPTDDYWWSREWPIITTGPATRLWPIISRPSAPIVPRMKSKEG